MGTAVTCVTEKETRYRHRQKLYADTDWKPLLLAIEKLNENGHGILKCWSGDEGLSKADYSLLKLVQTLLNK